MFNKIVLLYLILCLLPETTPILKCQVLDRQIFSAGSAHLTGNNFEVTWLMTDQILTTIGNGRVTQGFLQPDDSMIPTRVSHLEPIECRLYPNPFNHVLFLDFNNVTGQYDIQIYDILGRLHLKNALIEPSRGITNLDVSALPIGTYFIQIFCKDKPTRFSTFQLVKI